MMCFAFYLFTHCQFLEVLWLLVAFAMLGFRNLKCLVTLIAPLDFEVSREYYLSVEGSRGKSSLSDITTVIINVTDMNDNAPVFKQGVYSTEILEDLTPGSLIMKVRTKCNRIQPGHAGDTIQAESNANI
ncbi:hypothetical protein GOODEAATRI_000523 [Goodea atripinnis]|uniref:Cadherin domain-containing protein n=1 Tax=Goodea atripinnis TaxID=208336 RepID=A0ABV0NRU2_9TELE